MTEKSTRSSGNSKGGMIFKKMLEDKKAIRAHVKKGGKLSDLKNLFKFAKPLSIKKYGY